MYFKAAVDSDIQNRGTVINKYEDGISLASALMECRHRERGCINIDNGFLTACDSLQCAAIWLSHFG